MVNRKILGKGLDALIPGFEMGVPQTKAQGVAEIYLETIIPNRKQPRRHFDDFKLNELVESIREKGVIQPIVVKKNQKGYEIIVGERRWRASKLAGLQKVPAVIQDVSDKESLEIAIMENIHRQDLNPIEEAKAYYRLASDFGLKQEQIAKRVGKNRASIANFIRLLKLPKKTQEDILADRLSMGHARALLGLSSEEEIEVLRQRIIKNNLSVRETEGIVKKGIIIVKRKKNGKIIGKNVFLKNVETELERKLGTKVEISSTKKGGRIRIAYYSDDDLERLRNLFISKID